MLIVLTLLIVVEVISRYFFNTSFTFVTGMTAFLFPWMVFFGCDFSNC
ncbi:TRAP transporter small permease subunit [Alkalibacillus haloalkaliphilus]